MSVLRKVSWHQLQGIFYYVGRIITWVSVMMVFPLLVSLAYREWNIAVDFVLSMSVGLSFGLALQLIPKPKGQLSWLEGMTIASLSWIFMVLVSALPFWLSGFYLSYLDTIFDAMSGYTTTGLSVVTDLDHLPYGVNMWRQLICFLGGQGVVVLVLTFFLKNAPGSFKLYVGEAKSDKILPNVIHTARAIWYIGLMFLAIGTVSLGTVAFLEGMRPDRALLHGLWIFLAGWSGAGYTPQSQSILYYHSTVFELLSLAFMLLGSINFALHYAVLTKKRRELWQNIETKAYIISIMTLLMLLYLGLNRLGVYSTTFALFRKGFFQLISAHTGTGYATVYSADFAFRWGALPVFALILAMLFGGMTGSTAGGLKMLRVGIVGKGVIQDVKRLFYPESAVVVTKFHFYSDMVLNDQHVRSALTIIILYILTFAVGSGVGAMYGYPLTAAAFESASAVGNVGLSAGITSAAMPAGMKITYILIMYLARLEFLSVFALIAIIIAGVTRKARRVF
ncbi:TrkH family potassium uptake protein [Paradesulfitobacterium aromaticivorans]